MPTTLLGPRPERVRGGEAAAYAVLRTPATRRAVRPGARGDLDSSP
ncbi:hypothetical protein [Nocardioides sp. KR10-350]